RGADLLAGGCDLRAARPPVPAPGRPQAVVQGLRAADRLRPPGRLPGPGEPGARAAAVARPAPGRRGRCGHRPLLEVRDRLLAGLSVTPPQPSGRIARGDPAAGSFSRACDYCSLTTFSAAGP